MTGLSATGDTNHLMPLSRAEERRRAAGPMDCSAPLSAVTPTALRHLVPSLTHSFPNTACPLSASFALPFYGCPPPFVRHPGTGKALLLKIGGAGLRADGTDYSSRTGLRYANNADLHSKVSLLPGGGVQARPRAPAATGEVCGTITCYYDFLGNVYIFTIAQPLLHFS